MTTRHQTELQAILDAAVTTAKAAPTAANISAVDAARKALDNHLAGVRFEKLESKTDPDVLSYLNSHGWKLKGSKLSADAKAGKLIQRNGFYYAKDIDIYAKTWCKPANSVIAPENDESRRFKAAQASLLENKLKLQQGELIPKDEEEIRDARLWQAVRNDLENMCPGTVNRIINRIFDMELPDDVQQRISSLIPELRQEYSDELDDILDRYAKDGGIEA